MKRTRRELEEQTKQQQVVNTIDAGMRTEVVASSSKSVDAKSSEKQDDVPPVTKKRKVVKPASPAKWSLW